MVQMYYYADVRINA